jgi:hypothetical protein
VIANHIAAHVASNVFVAYQRIRLMVFTIHPMLIAHSARPATPRRKRTTMTTMPRVQQSLTTSAPARLMALVVLELVMVVL